MSRLSEDMNPYAIAWGRFLLELITLSASPQHFVASLFARERFPAEGLRAENQWKYLEEEVSRELRTGWSESVVVGGIIWEFNRFLTILYNFSCWMEWLSTS